MNVITKYFAGIATTVMLLTILSCSKNFLTEKNTNQDAPSSVLPNALLTPIEVSLAYTQGGDMSRFTSLFTQQATGVSGQPLAYYEYVLTSQDPQTLWNNMYAADMYNDYSLMQQCSTGTYNAYKGITEALMGYSLQLMVDCWGSVPYSHAFQGANNLKPLYDKDATAYNYAIALCYRAIADLNNTNYDILIPYSDDVVYEGNTAQWIKFAHAVLARLYIHQSQTGTGNVAMADSALIHANLSFASNADNARVVFGNAATNNAPSYQFYSQASGISFAFADGKYSTDGFFFGMLANTNDPRKFFLIDSVDEYYGVSLDSYYQLANAPVEFICYDEVQFIAAEATERMGGNGNVYYQNGIRANMQKLAADSNTLGIYGQLTSKNMDTYIADYGHLSLIPDSAYSQIAYQEYIALYLNPEAWTVWRRSTKIPGFSNGSPALLPVSGPYQGEGVPRRFLYPQSELNFNSANVPTGATEWSPRVFWDN